MENDLERSVRLHLSYGRIFEGKSAPALAIGLFGNET